MEDIEFCKADFLYMLEELNKYAIENDVKDVVISNRTHCGWLEFTHINEAYRHNNEWLYISLDIDNIDTAYEKFERMMKCMKEGALLVN